MANIAGSRVSLYQSIQIAMQASSFLSFLEDLPYYFVSVYSAPFYTFLLPQVLCSSGLPLYPGWLKFAFVLA